MQFSKEMYCKCAERQLECKDVSHVWIHLDVDVNQVRHNNTVPLTLTHCLHPAEQVNLGKKFPAASRRLGRTPMMGNFFSLQLL